MSGLKLEFQNDGAIVAPKSAATLLVLRDGASGLELFVVERAKGSKFLGGAMVFPGGKVDTLDASPEFESLVGAVSDPGWKDIAETAEAQRALGVAACREALEEALILPTLPLARIEELLALRAAMEKDEHSFATLLAQQHRMLDFGALRPFARWVTPEAETRRFDARFFLVRAPEGQLGAHDNFETTSSFWATAPDLLRRFVAGEIELAPPTHRILEQLAECTSVADAFALSRCLDIICPVLTPHRDAHGETMALALPGDPEHPVKEVRAPGRSRYVLRDGRWLPEDAP